METESNEAEKEKKVSGHLKREVMHVDGMKFITNFDIKDFAKYCEAIDKWEHGGKLTVKYVDCWGSKHRHMGSLYKDNGIRGLTPFWKIFDSLESA